MLSLNLILVLKLSAVITVVNSYHFALFLLIMVSFSNILAFTRPNKMELWSANTDTFFK